MTQPEMTDPEKTAAAAEAYLASLPANQADAIRALPPEKRLPKLIAQADIDIAPSWPTHAELIGGKDPVEVINWDDLPIASSSSNPG